MCTYPFNPIKKIVYLIMCKKLELENKFSSIPWREKETSVK